MTDPVGEYVTREPRPFPTNERVRAIWEMTHDPRAVAEHFNMPLEDAFRKINDARRETRHKKGCHDKS